MRTLHSVPYSHDVLHDEASGSYFLEAYCGGIASFLVRIDLTAEEIARFLEDPKSLDGLAREVQQHSGRRPE